MALSSGKSSAPLRIRLSLPLLNSGQIQHFSRDNVLYSRAVVNAGLLAGNKTFMEVFYSALS